MLKKIFGTPRHETSKSMAKYCICSVLLIMAVYHVLTYFIGTRLTVATLMALVLLYHTTSNPPTNTRF
jgi:hypothetical protein